MLGDEHEQPYSMLGLEESGAADVFVLLRHASGMGIAIIIFSNARDDRRISARFFGRVAGTV